MVVVVVVEEQLALSFPAWEEEVEVVEQSVLPYWALVVVEAVRRYYQALEVQREHQRRQKSQVWMMEAEKTNLAREWLACCCPALRAVEVVPWCRRESMRGVSRFRPPVVGLHRQCRLCRCRRWTIRRSLDGVVTGVRRMLE